MSLIYYLRNFLISNVGEFVFSNKSSYMIQIVI